MDEKYALLIIDIQRWFFRTEERRAGLPTLIENVNRLITLCEKTNVPIIHVLTVHKADKSTWNIVMNRENMGVLLEGTEEAEEYDEVTTSESHETVIKTRMNGFIRTNLEERLNAHGVNKIIFSGVFTHGCVGRTAIDAWERDFELVIAEDAVFSHNKPRADVMIHTLKSEFEAQFLTVSQIGEELLKIA